MNEIVVKNFNQLVKVLHSRKMFPRENDIGGHVRSNFVFRGMSDFSWDLKSSIQRKWPHINEVEKPSIRGFRKFAMMGTFQKNSFWEILSIAQHNGLPTRTLDWTNSPMVAAHFAVEEKEEIDKDGVIWCVNTTIWKKYILDSALRITLDQEKAWIFDINMLDAIFPNLDSLNNYKKKENLIGKTDSEMIFYEPPSLDQRIQNQYGVLSTITDPYIDIDKYLRLYAKKHKNLVTKIKVTADAKNNIKDKLEQNNINERMLFPGLPGLCQWLTRYYSNV